MKTGIHVNIGIEEYHADKTIVSSSGLKQAKLSSRHFARYVQVESEKKLTLDFGNAFEIALMDAVNKTKEFERTCLVFDDTKRPEKDKGITSKINQARKKEIISNDKYVIPKNGDKESKEALDQMVQSIMSEPVISQRLTKVDYQKSFVWIDKETGVKCKTRPDIAINRQKILVDIKTTKDASPNGFARECANYDYPLQAVMQIEGVINTGYFDKVDEYFWLAIEKTPPYNAVLYVLRDEDRAFLIDNYTYYLKRCAKVLEALKKDKDYYKIQGYSENADNKYGVIDLDLPLYYNR